MKPTLGAVAALFLVSCSSGGDGASNVALAESAQIAALRERVAALEALTAGLGSDVDVLKAREGVREGPTVLLSLYRATPAGEVVPRLFSVLIDPFTGAAESVPLSGTLASVGGLSSIPFTAADETRGLFFAGGFDPLSGDPIVIANGQESLITGLPEGSSRAFLAVTAFRLGPDGGLFKIRPGPVFPERLLVAEPR